MAFLKRAEESAKENRSKNLDTVVFFDEANTTDAIGLIKEVMCDRRVHGNPISHDLKFIAACNPYRRWASDSQLRVRVRNLVFSLQAYPRDGRETTLCWTGVLCERDRNTAETRFDLNML